MGFVFQLLTAPSAAEATAARVRFPLFIAVYPARKNEETRETRFQAHKMHALSKQCRIARSAPRTTELPLLELSPLACARCHIRIWLPAASAARYGGWGHQGCSPTV